MINDCTGKLVKIEWFLDQKSGSILIYHPSMRNMVLKFQILNSVSIREQDIYVDLNEN